MDFPPFSPPGLGGEAGGVIKVTLGGLSSLFPTRIRRRGRKCTVIKVTQGALPPFPHQEQGERQEENKGNSGDPSSIPPPGTGENRRRNKGNSGDPSSIPPPGTGGRQEEE